MSQQQHTQEPWITHNGGVYSAKAKDEKLYAEMSVAACHTPEDARRIVACVNACAGISTANLEENIPIKELASRYNEALQQRDTLLAALKKLSGMKLNMIADGIVDKAIAEVGKGGAA